MIVEQRVANLTLYDVLFFVLLSLIISLFWLFPYPAIVDAPQHATQLKILEQLIQGEPFYEQRFRINWFTPYILPNIFLVSIAYLFSPLIAIKSAITLYLITLPLVGRALVLYFKKPRAAQLLCLCFLYSPGLYWGFIPFLVSISFGVFWLYLILTHKTTVNSGISLTLSVVLMLSHAIGWVLVVFNILAIHFLRERFSKKQLFNAIPMTLPFLVLCFWTWQFSSVEESSTEIAETIYGSLIDKLATLFFSILGDNIRYLSLLKALLLFTIFSRLVNTLSRINYIHKTLLLNVALYFALPSILFSTAFIADRAFSVVLILLPLTITSIPKLRLFVVNTVTMITISIISILINQILVHREIKSYHKSTSLITKQSDVFYISKFDDLGYFELTFQPAPIFLHFPHWLSNTKNVNVDYNFAFVHNIMLRTTNNDYPWNGQVSYNYDSIRWEKVNELGYDYLFVRNCNISNQEIVQIALRSTYILQSSEGCWHLFEKTRVD